MQTIHNRFYQKTLRKFTEGQGPLAVQYRDGVEKAFHETHNSGMDAHWTELELREDGNGNLAWYVDLYSCSQQDYMTHIAVSE